MRCIKPNQTKEPKNADEHYILSQIRYLGVFETIQIRKKTFPSRKTYDEFVEFYSELHPKAKRTSKKDYALELLRKITKNSKDYLLGEVRVYVTDSVENALNHKLYQLLKTKNEKAFKIQRAFKKYKFRKDVFKKLKLIVKRKKIWKCYAERKRIDI